MEQETNMAVNSTENEEMTNETNTQQGKTFTQEEVNSFIQSRAGRMKAQAEKAVKAEYEAKLADLEAREMRIKVIEELTARSMPKELADVITCSSDEDLKKKLDTLAAYIKAEAQAEQKEEKPQGFKFGATSGSMAAGVDPTRKAMGLK